MNYCALIYDGIRLDDMDGYLTTNVEGRGLHSPLFTSQTVPGRDGDLILGQTMGPVDLIVHFLIRADNDKQYRAILQKLNEILIKDHDVPIIFEDEDGVRYGRFSGYSNPPYDQNVGNGTFTLHCADPYIYINKVDFTGSSFVIDADPCLKLIWDKIQLTATTPHVQITNTTTGQVINLTGMIAGDQVEITKEAIMVNGKSKISVLDFATSTWKGFAIKQNDKIVMDGADPKTIRFSAWRASL